MTCNIVKLPSKTAKRKVLIPVGIGLVDPLIDMWNGFSKGLKYNIVSKKTNDKHVVDLKYCQLTSQHVLTGRNKRNKLQFLIPFKNLDMFINKGEVIKPA